MTKNETPAVSVIIPALNEAQYIGSVLKQLKSQTFKDFEVIVADSVSTDHTGEAARAKGNGLDLKVVRCRQKGQSLARNSGAQQARADYLLFLDADISIPPGLIEAMHRASTDYGADMITTRFKADCSNLFDRMMIGGWSGFMRLVSKMRQPVVIGGCCLIAKGLHERIGGFNEAIDYSEDTDYSYRLNRVGARYLCLKEPIVKFSCRRYAQDGRLYSLRRDLRAEIYRQLHRGKLGGKKVKYQFGHYGKERR